ncbi:2-succinyl-6-hydroxy-2,4-cyclohexadiene-1-carboxylate synthase [Brumimicrobium salinarum]|uniref:2-succinyl-6-hydroxy-2, 4-cyclohexadiene-1-carboxylate synthase n=1 Tax=Brumimicrobium salinarum TaxID=2058658 RepID=A0A2I0R1J2_9FLAO|nr:alpha/beta hydrolase [Brumimicrobium salinarum]PKR80280.1 2-succinyl-6-hydroxy-2,4-cyclohexadiene-1-carboxylate synthase [Brumimicrobium salinarum]
MLSYSIFENKNTSKWVTFVHGAGGSSSIWFRQIRAFKDDFNILLIDLRGHGASKTPIKNINNQKYTFEVVSNDVLEVLNHLNIKKSHFIGISLGTILIRDLAERNPERVESMVMGGAILKLNVRSKFLIKFGNVFKSVVPYIFLYKLFAFIIMPRKNHKESRSLFVKEAKKLYQKEFKRWYKLTTELTPLLKLFRMKDISIPTFYIMGEQDHLFLPSIKEVISKHLSAQLHVIKNCGHVVNVEQPVEFNHKVLSFLKKQKA